MRYLHILQLYSHSCITLLVDIYIYIYIIYIYMSVIEKINQMIRRPSNVVFHIPHAGRIV